MIVQLRELRLRHVAVQSDAGRGVFGEIVFGFAGDPPHKPEFGVWDGGQSKGLGNVAKSLANRYPTDLDHSKRGMGLGGRLKQSRVGTIRIEQQLLGRKSLPEK